MVTSFLSRRFIFLLYQCQLLGVHVVEAADRRVLATAQGYVVSITLHATLTNSTGYLGCGLDWAQWWPDIPWGQQSRWVGTTCSCCYLLAALLWFLCCSQSPVPSTKSRGKRSEEHTREGTKGKERRLAHLRVCYSTIVY